MNHLQASEREDSGLADRSAPEAGPAEAARVKSGGSVAASSRSQLVGITDDLLRETCEFLHHELNGHISVEQWMSHLRYPWIQQKTDYGVALLRPNEGIVGVLVAFYSDQIIEGRVERFANLAHWCVKPAFRRESLRLLKEMMAQKELTLTGFTSTREAVKILSRLGWKKLDDHVYVIPNFGFSCSGRNLRVLTAFNEIFAIVDERHKRIMSDHGRASRGRYVLVTDGNRWCLSVHTIEVRKGIRFSIPIYFSDHSLFRQWMGRFLSAYRSLDGCWATLCPPRFLPRPPTIAVRLVEPRPQNFRSRSVAPVNVTALYSDAIR